MNPPRAGSSNSISGIVGSLVEQLDFFKGRERLIHPYRSQQIVHTALGCCLMCALSGRRFSRRERAELGRELKAITKGNSVELEQGDVALVRTGYLSHWPDTAALETHRTCPDRRDGGSVASGCTNPLNACAPRAEPMVILAERHMGERVDMRAGIRSRQNIFAHIAETGVVAGSPELCAGHSYPLGDR
jgi:hypothetical protein